MQVSDGPTTGAGRSAGGMPIHAPLQRRTQTDIDYRTAEVRGGKREPERVSPTNCRHSAFVRFQFDLISSPLASPGGYQYATSSQQN